MRHMIELGPCPFCGERGTGLMVRRGVICLFTVGCNNPKCTANPATELCMTIEQAIGAWNSLKRRQDGV